MPFGRLGSPLVELFGCYQVQQIFKDIFTNPILLCAIGPEEELPRPMDCFEFVCHAPSEYYRSKSTPCPTIPSKPEIGYICTPMEPPTIDKVPTQEEIYGLTEERQLLVTGRKERRKDKNNVAKKEKEVVKKEPVKKETSTGRRGRPEGSRKNGRESRD